MDGVPATIETLVLGDGRSLCLRRWAGSEPETLVALHGLLDSSEGWAELGASVRCSRIAFDLPGFGYSDTPGRGSIEGYARDVIEGLALLGVDRFTLVGHSLGGAVATAIAELIPDRVAALVLLAPAGFGRIGLAEAISIPGVRMLVQAGLPFALSSRLAVTASYMTVITNGEMPQRAVIERVTKRARSLVDGAREGTRAVVDAGRSPDAFHRRQVQYSGPVFAVWGEHDRLVPPSHSKGLLTALPQADVDIWRGMGHHALAERFDDATALIARAVAAGRRQSAEPLRLAREAA